MGKVGEYLLVFMVGSLMTGCSLLIDGSIALIDWWKRD